MTGTPEQIAAAQAFIDRQIELHRATGRTIAEQWIADGGDPNADVGGWIWDAVEKIVGKYNQILTDTVREKLIELLSSHAVDAFFERAKEIADRGGVQGGRA